MKNKQKFYIKIFWATYILPFLFVMLLFILISFGKLGFMPTFEDLENPKSNLASEVYSTDQVVLGSYFKENRSLSTYDELPPVLVDALIATEDERFRSHSGIDFRSLGRVVVKTIFGGNKSSGGGSTITQQLAKNLFPRERFNNPLQKVLRKLREWVIAVKLEKRYTKEEIIAMYFNKFDFLNHAVGIKSAARVYFGLTPDSLNIEQAAMLVGMAKNPSFYNPLRRPDTTKHRRNVVFAQMLKNNYISIAKFDSLKKLPMKLDYHKVDHKLGNATYFREYLRTTLSVKKPKRENYFLADKYREDSLEWENNPIYGWCNKNKKPDDKPYDIYRDGLKIYTTINAKMQKYAEEAVKEHLSKYLQPLFFKQQKGRKKAPFSWRISDKQIKKIMYVSMKRSERYRALKKAKYDSIQIIKNFNTPTKMYVFSWKGDIDTTMTPMDSILYYKYFLHAGFMSLEPQTGYVRAYVGDIDYNHFKFDHVMTAKRQVGSTFKPFVYTIAMMPGGFSPCHKVPNINVSFSMPDNKPDYTPKFSSGGYLKKYEGKMVSLKFGLANSMNQISAWVLKQYSPEAVIEIVKKMGINSYIPPVFSICVGAAEIKLSEMVGAYDTYANKGVFVKPMLITRIEDRNGNVISVFKPQMKEVISEGTAYRMVQLMRGVIDGGTSTRIRYKYGLKNEIAGKTGTTNDNSDGWFIGFTPNLVSGVWVGGEERSIRFMSTTYGQGANMALPIWALYMKKVYADKSLGIKKTPFYKYKIKDGIETDCKKYKQFSSEINASSYIPEDEKY